MIVRYANQKKIHVNREPTPKTDFILLSNNSYDNAVLTLSRSGLILYLYLVNNSDGFQLFLSQADVECRTGLAKNTYYRAVKELEDKGFLVQPDPAVNNWEFYETPQKG